MMRAVYMVLGLAFVALGFIGAFLPVLPTVPFLILAAACFARSSTRLEAWLFEHKVFGSMLRDWRNDGAIPLRGKIAAVGGCIVGYAVFFWRVQPGLGLGLLVAAIMVGGMSYVVSRPTAPR